MTRFVAEIGPANGSVGYALTLVDAMFEAGADVIKGQLFTADGLVTDNAPRYDRTGGNGGTQHEAFQKQLTLHQWWKVAYYVNGLPGLRFTATPFDLESIDFLVRCNPPFIKIASADITHRILIQTAARTGIPLVISTGAAYLDEIDRALQWARQAGATDVTLLACTLSYPTAPEHAHVARMGALAQTFEVPVGYSDHTVGWSAAETARQQGAALVEKHVTLTPGKGGDHDFAATARAVNIWTSGRAMWTDRRVVGDGSLSPRGCEVEARRLARRSVCAARDMSAGHVLSESDVTWLRPGTGIDPWVDVSGATLTRDVKARTTLGWDDIE